MSNAGKQEKSRFPNFAESPMSVQIINQEPRISEFSHLRCLSSLFALRVPSEALALKRAFDGDELTEFPPFADRELIGLRGPDNDLRLAVRFSHRKNLPKGCIVSRHCFLQAFRRYSSPDLPRPLHLATY